MASMTFIHNHSGVTILPLLSPLLPATLPLVRRIQFHCRSPQSCILASFPASTTVLPKSYVVAFCDRSSAPEPEAWIFCSIEVSSAPPYDTLSQYSEHEQQAHDCKAHLVSLFRKIRSLPPPQGTDTTIDPTTMLIAALHSRTFDLIRNSDELIIKVLGERFKRYVIDTRRNPPRQTPLAPNLTFAPLSPVHFPLLLRHTHTSWQTSTLHQCPTMGIFPTSPAFYPEPTPGEPPIAHCFLGPDGSLRAGYCAKEYRNQGLARAVAQKLIAQGHYLFADDGFVHADAGVENYASQASLEELGAKCDCEIYCPRIQMESNGLSRL